MAYTLKSCVWEITLACCFHCKYCGSSGGIAQEDELSTKECLNIVEQLDDLGCQRVSLIGGEVFLRPDWSEIVSNLARHHIRTSIITNGYLFNEEIIGKLKEFHIESIAISLDSVESIHDKYRQKGSFNRAKKAAEILAQNKIPVSIISTLNSENVLYLTDFYEIIKTWNIVAWQLQACSPMGNTLKNEINYIFDANKVIEFVGTHAFKAPFIIGIADNIGYYTSKEGYLRGNLSGQGVFHGCRAGITAIGIDSVGNVRGCESMYDDCFNEGNLRKKTLRDIWESPTAFSYNRNFKKELLTGECASCKYSSRCAGGCRSYNHFVHRKLYESPYCARNIL